ncbi:hypothetical protein PMIN03_013102 [Paraphaeosphaeria minitans]
MIEMAVAGLTQITVSPRLISYLADKSAQAVPSCILRKVEPRPPPTCFIESVVRNSSVSVPTLVTSLVYLRRFRSRFPPNSETLPFTVHRVFFAALILAAKYLNDTSPTNKAWASYSIMPSHGRFGFTIAEVNLMERQLLYVLDWDVCISSEDFCSEIWPLTMFLVQRPLELTDAERQAKCRCLPKVGHHMSSVPDSRPRLKQSSILGPRSTVGSVRQSYLSQS